MAVDSPKQISSQHCLAVIPARGGSKGIPRKNLKLLAGKPLIAHSIDAALQARLVDRVVVSTDDDEINARRFSLQTSPRIARKSRGKSFDSRLDR